MKQNILYSIALVCLTCTLHAQEKTHGFYLNPNLNMSNQNHIGIGATLSPELQVGYLWRKKNRQSISINSFGGTLSEWYQAFHSSMKYSYDYSVYKHKKVEFFLAVFAKATIGMSRYRTIATSNQFAHTRQNNLNFQIGISPQIEYKLTKKIDFVASVPINLISIQKQNLIEKNTPNPTYYKSNMLLKPNLEANIGIRINLFNKK